MKIGIDSGAIVGGVVGVRKYIFDIFGDTVNTAFRLQTLSVPMSATISEATARLLPQGSGLVARPPRNVKGKGEMKSYYLKYRDETGLSRAKTPFALFKEARAFYEAGDLVACKDRLAAIDLSIAEPEICRAYYHLSSSLARREGRNEDAVGLAVMAEQFTAGAHTLRVIPRFPRGRLFVFACDRWPGRIYCRKEEGPHEAKLRSTCYPGPCPRGAERSRSRIRSKRCRHKQRSFRRPAHSDRGRSTIPPTSRESRRASVFGCPTPCAAPMSIRASYATRPMAIRSTRPISSASTRLTSSGPSARPRVLCKRKMGTLWRAFAFYRGRFRYL